MQSMTPLVINTYLYLGIICYLFCVLVIVYVQATAHFEYSASSTIDDGPAKKYSEMTT